MQHRGTPCTYRCVVDVNTSCTVFGRGREFAGVLGFVPACIIVFSDSSTSWSSARASKYRQCLSTKHGLELGGRAKYLVSAELLVRYCTLQLLAKSLSTQVPTLMAILPAVGVMAYMRHA